MARRPGTLSACSRALAWIANSSAGGRVQMIGESGKDQVVRVARRVWLGPEWLDEVRAVLTAVPPSDERELITLWWDTDRD